MMIRDHQELWLVPLRTGDTSGSARWFSDKTEAEEYANFVASEPVHVMVVINKKMDAPGPDFGRAP